MKVYWLNLSKALKNDYGLGQCYSKGWCGPSIGGGPICKQGNLFSHNYTF